MRAKFRVESVTKYAWGQEKVKLNAVMGNPGEFGENATFAKATPSGSLEISIDNPAAQGFLKPGSDYYLDFTEAPPTK